MAPKQGAQRLSDYVQSKDPGDVKRRSGVNSRTGKYDDLKAAVPKNVQTANSRQPRVQAPHEAQQQGRGDQTQGKRQSNGEKRFYDTDTSSMGGTSDTPSTLQVQAAPPPAVHTEVSYTENETAEPSSEGQYAEGGSENQDDYDDDEEDDPDNPLTIRLNDRQRQLMEYLDAMKANSKTGQSLPYVKGDSYPSTTSGPSSVYQTDERRPTHTEQRYATAAVPLPTRGQGQRQPPGRQQAQDQHHAQPQPSQAPQRQPQDPPANVHFERPDVPDQSMLQHQAAENFSFAARKANASAKALANNQRQGEPVVSRSRQPHAQAPERTNGPPAPTAPTRAERNVNQAHDSNKATRHSISKPQQGVPRIVQPPQPKPAQEDGDLSDHEQDEPKVPTPKERTVDLDYHESELYKMEFASLKSQSFDFDPRKGPSSFPGVAEDGPIDKQVETVATFRPEDQDTFMAALPIDEWEQAGDWFLGKFGETLAKLKNIRQEKRKAARAFEKEIEARHLAVTKKRKLTVSALDEMRASGAMVLEGTPKKSKKTK